MTIVVWIIFGGLVGLVASKIMGGSGGLLFNVILGVIGASVGGLVMKFFGKSGVSGLTSTVFLSRCSERSY